MVAWRLFIPRHCFVTPVQHSARDVHARLTLPRLLNRALVPKTMIRGLPFPCCMENYSAYNTDQDQPHSSQDEICPCTEASKACAQGLIARSSQEIERLVRERFDVYRRHFGGFLVILEGLGWR